MAEVRFSFLDAQAAAERKHLVGGRNLLCFRFTFGADDIIGH